MNEIIFLLYFTFVSKVNVIKWFYILIFSEILLLKYIFCLFKKPLNIKWFQIFRKVPKGTNGGVSFVGLLCSFGGGLAVGVAYYVGVVLGSAQLQLRDSPNQLYIILLGGAGGLIGSLIDSLLGATVQVNLVLFRHERNFYEKMTFFWKNFELSGKSLRKFLGRFEIFTKLSVNFFKYFDIS